MAEFHIPTAVIVGGESLMARDLREVLNTMKPAPDVRLVSGVAGSAKLALVDEEAAVLAPLDVDAFDGAGAVFLAGTAEASQRALELAGDSDVTLIDLTGSLEDHPGSRLRAPQIEAADDRGAASIHVVAHPAAVALALFFGRLSRFAIERSLVEVFEPASERGQAGLTELQSQCVNLLSFKPLPKDVYDAQVAYALLARYGEESPHNLEEVEARIDRHLATLLLAGSGMPMPSLRLIQAPVFHGYTFSIRVEFSGDAPNTETLEEALACAQIEVRRAADEAPNNVAAAGESVLIAGGVRPDRNHSRAYWFWLVADNLRLRADTAAAVAREHL